MSSPMKLYLLGPPRLERDGVPLEFDTRKNVALIAYLAVTGESHSRETLITLLWPELEPSRARAGLRRNLSVLKKALGGEWLVVDRETIGTGVRQIKRVSIARKRAAAPSRSLSVAGLVDPFCWLSLARRFSAIVPSGKRRLMRSYWVAPAGGRCGWGLGRVLGLPPAEPSGGRCNRAFAEKGIYPWCTGFS